MVIKVKKFQKILVCIIPIDNFKSYHITYMINMFI